MAMNRDDYSVFVISIDDVEWTRHWLGGKRCDQLLVYVARRANVFPLLRIRAIESKATSRAEPIEPRVDMEPFTEGIEQVIATLDALWSILAPTGVDQLVEDLRFASFVEHLASVVLSELYPFESTDVEKLHVVQVVSSFSKRAITPDQVHLDAAVVCTQYRTAIPRKVVQLSLPGESRSWVVFLVRAGTTELDALLGATTLRIMVDTIVEQSEESNSTSDEVTVNADEEPMEQEVEDGLLLIGNTLQNQDAHDEIDDSMGDSTFADKEMQLLNEAEQIIVRDNPNSYGVNEYAIQLAQDLYVACRQRMFPVEPPLVENIIAGPSLVSISLALQSGADLQPIQRNLYNLAREVGVVSIAVENDTQRPYHVRFLVARRDRQFPALPVDNAPLIDKSTQSYLGLYLGQDTEGKDYLSYVSTWPHMLIGGTTGSGKTTYIRSLLRQVARLDSDLVKVIIIDGKGEIDYLSILSESHFPPRFPEVLMGHDNVIQVFDWLVTDEIPRRRRVIRDRAAATQGRPRQAREIYIDATSEGLAEPFPPLIVVIDEFAEIMISGGATSQRFEQMVQQVAQVGRSMLVHLLLATQRPDASVVSGAVKVNFPTRTALRLPTHHDSVTILGGKGAESLLGRGDLIFQSSAQPPIRLQGYSD